MCARYQNVSMDPAVYRDKVYACWQGKNVGGTMGTPFENKPGPLNVTGYTTPKGEPYIQPNGRLTVTVELRNPQYDAQWLNVRVYTPEGWTADYQKSVCFLHRSSCSTGPKGLGHVTGCTSWQVTFTAGETVEAVNRIPVTMEIMGYPMPLYIPLTVLG